jgi:hypothetical protein
MPAWDIETERREAEHFALRASVLEELHMPGAHLFRELAELSDRKIELFKKIEHNHQTLADAEWKKKARESGHIPWEDLEL